MSDIERRRFARGILIKLRDILNTGTITVNTLIETLDEFEHYAKIPLRKNELINQKRFINYLHESDPSEELLDLIRSTEITFKPGAHNKELLNLTICGDSEVCKAVHNPLSGVKDELISIASRWSGKRIFIRTKIKETIKDYKPRKRA